MILAKSGEWQETERREVGVATGDVRDTGANFTLLYMVTERRKSGGGMEWRERLVPGVTLYQVKEMMGTTSTMLEIVAKGVKALAAIARNEDERATSRRKAR